MKCPNTCREYYHCDKNPVIREGVIICYTDLNTAWKDSSEGSLVDAATDKRFVSNEYGRFE